MMVLVNYDLYIYWFIDYSCVNPEGTGFEGTARDVQLHKEPAQRSGRPQRAALSAASYH